MAVRIINADVFDGLRQLPDESVHCVITSPPYWGLRDYGIEPSIWGGEADCEHGWGEFGKSAQRLRNGEGSNTAKQSFAPVLHPSTGQFCRHCNAWRGCFGLEPTIELHVEHAVSIFREVRRVLRKDGTLWLNYGDCYASSPNGRSAADTKALGKDDRTFRDKPVGVPPGLKPKDLVMMPARIALALQADGWWLRSEIVWAKPNPMPESVTDRPTSAHEKIFLLAKSARYFYDADAVRENHISLDRPPGNKSRIVGGREWNNGDFRPSIENSFHELGRNLRNVWTIATAPFPEAHFATFPPALIEPCVKAGCPKDGTVLDPFGGSGTTGLVADRLGRNATLIELNPEYAAMAQRRIEGDAGLFAEVAAE